jgi:acetylornithine deacetylase
MVPQFKARGLTRPIHLALSCDEEVGCRGVRPLVSHIRENLPKPRAVIVGEPTSMKVVNAHKSTVTFTTEVTGLEAHSSLTNRGVNAIMVAGELLAEINRIRSDVEAKGDPSGRFDPPHSTVHVGLIDGGTAKNIIPRRCTFHWEMRLLPGADYRPMQERFEAFSRSLEPAMKAFAADIGISTRISATVPGLAPETDTGLETLVMHLANANGTHTAPYVTEAGLFQQSGVPTIICGPGSVEPAHRPDEYIEDSELVKCEEFMQRLMDHCG